MGSAQLFSLLELELYTLYCTPVRAPSQLPAKSTEFGVEFPASLTAVSCGGVSLNAVKHFRMPKNTVYSEVSVILASEASR